METETRQNRRQYHLDACEHHQRQAIAAKRCGDLPAMRHHVTVASRHLTRSKLFRPQAVA